MRLLKTSPIQANVPSMYVAVLRTSCGAGAARSFSVFFFVAGFFVVFFVAALTLALALESCLAWCETFIKYFVLVFVRTLSLTAVFKAAAINLASDFFQCFSMSFNDVPLRWLSSMILPTTLCRHDDLLYGFDMFGWTISTNLYLFTFTFKFFFDVTLFFLFLMDISRFMVT